MAAARAKRRGAVGVVASAILAGAALAQPAPSPRAPSVYAVVFTAQWCPNCRIADPAVRRAVGYVNNPALGTVWVDLTSERTWTASNQAVVDAGVDRVHNLYVTYTGLTVLTAADSGEPLGCLTRAQSDIAMAEAMRAALERVRTFPAGRRGPLRPTCPPPRTDR